MKHPAWGCLVALAGLATAAGAIAALLQLRYGVGLPDSIGVSLLGGLLLWASANLVWSAWQRWREARVLALGIAGGPPTEGWTVLVGTLEPRGALLYAPLNAAPCLAYSYEVKEDRGQGRRRTIFTHFKGVALAPSAVRTATGSYPLFAVPDIEQAEAVGMGQAHAAEAFRRYASTTRFSGSDTSADELVQRWADNDGAYRSDVAYSSIEQVDFPVCQLAQASVRPGSSVTVVGQFSSAKNGIVASSGWQTSPRLIVGDAAAVKSVLVATAGRRLLLAALAGAAAAGLIAAFMTYD